MTKVEKAISLATKAHEGQTRWGGEPYIVHPQAVAKAVQRLNETTICVAWLHDVVEDTDVTIDEIRDGFGESVADGVYAITKKEKESYKDYILRVSDNMYATTVKIADLKDNLKTLKRGSMKDKYELALYFLQTYGAK